MYSLSFANSLSIYYESVILSMNSLSIIKCYKSLAILISLWSNMFMWIHSIQYQSTIFITNWLSLLRIHLDFDIIFANREFTVLIVKSLLIHCDYRQFALILIQTHYLYGSFTLNSLFSSTGHFRYRKSLWIHYVHREFAIYYFIYHEKTEFFEFCFANCRKMNPWNSKNWLWKISRPSNHLRA